MDPNKHSSPERRRAHKLTLWSGGLYLLALVFISVAVNSGDAGWAWLVLALFIAATAFLIWSESVRKGGKF
jgi:hypothetical protein